MSTNTSHHPSNMVVDSWWFGPEHLDTFLPQWLRAQQQIYERMVEKEGNQCAAKARSKSLLKVALQATDLWTVVLAFLRTLSSSAKTVLLIMSVHSDAPSTPSILKILLDWVEFMRYHPSSFPLCSFATSIKVISAGRWPTVNPFHTNIDNMLELMVPAREGGKV